MFAGALALACASSTALRAADDPVAAFPDTDIFLLDLQQAQSPPRNITARPGYDNQPAFSADGAQLLYSAAMNSQTEVFVYDIRRDTRQRLTHTKGFEFSPSFMPSGSEILVNRVRGGLNSSGQLWAYSLQGEPLRRVSAAFTALAYYAWADRHTVVAMINENKSPLLIVDVGSGNVSAGPMGQFPLPTTMPHTISYWRGGGENEKAEIHLFSVHSHESRPVTRPVGNKPYLAWNAASSLWMAKDNVIYSWSAGDKSGWTPHWTFSQPGLGNISRLAISPGGRYLAIVSQPTVAKSP